MFIGVVQRRSVYKENTFTNRTKNVPKVYRTMKETSQGEARERESTTN